MTKPSRQAQKPKTKTPFHQNKWAVAAVLICIIVLFGIAWAAVAKVQNDHAIKKEKQQFTQAEQDINQIAAAITAQIGKPADQKTNKSCGYSSQEFSKGFLSCDIDNEVVFSVADKIAAKNLADKVREVITSQIVFSYTSSSNNFANRSYDSVSAPDNFLEESYIEKDAGLDCHVGYFFFFASYPPSGFPPFNVAPNSQNLLVETNCSAYVKQPIYPIQQ